MATSDCISECKSEEALSFIAELMAQRKLTVITLGPYYRAQVEEVIAKALEASLNPPLDEPEAQALLIAKRLKDAHEVVLLSENKGVQAACSTIDEFKGIRVWTSLDLLVKAAKEMNLAEEELLAMIREYTEQTGHHFRRKKIAKALQSYSTKPS